MQQFDVVIVGGAAVGSAAAYFLAAEPAFQGSVLVLEQDFSYAHCATARSAASIRHQFSTAENVRMSLFGTAFLRGLGDTLAVDGHRPDVAFAEAGYLFLATPSGQAVLQANQALQQSLGADIAQLSPSQISARWPWLHTGDLAAGAFGQSGEGWLDAYALMQALRRKAIALGASYRQAQVVGVQRQGRRVSGVRLASGEVLACGTLINAAGTGAPALARAAGISSLPIESRKRSVFFVTSPEIAPGCPMVIDPSGAYFRPEGQGFICGIAPPADQDPECFDFDVQHALFDELLWPLLAARVPGFEALRVQHAWAGHYDVNTLDHNLIIGAHPDLDNLLFANGFSGHGLQQSPAVGRALSELVTFGGYRTLDLSVFGWQRVLQGRPVLELNVV
ncbi:NAD(P)/FAD-dependent oxidoreductase [Variovorax sp. HJSM1_2]|uniref:NAD(P)/FAD-dependent oxidoreductase n=1 Tax=Variovorax sp. HJSM1_2 TaxID=3366263 RepID=UPI003BDE9A77